MENPEIFKYSEDRKCFKHLGELIDQLQQEQKSNNIIISSPFLFIKAGNIHPNMNSYITTLKIFCIEKNVKLIDNTNFINKHRHNTSLLKGTKAILYKFLTAYGVQKIPISPRQSM